MLNELLQKLETQIDSTVETIELLKIQIEELEEKNKKLAAEKAALQSEQSACEQDITKMMEKLIRASHNKILEPA